MTSTEGRKRNRLALEMEDIEFVEIRELTKEDIREANTAFDSILKKREPKRQSFQGS